MVRIAFLRSHVFCYVFTLCVSVLITIQSSKWIDSIHISVYSYSDIVLCMCECVYIYFHSVVVQEKS